MQKTYPLWPSYLEIWRIEKKLQLQENSITSLLSSACMSNWRLSWDSALTISIQLKLTALKFLETQIQLTLKDSYTSTNSSTFFVIDTKGLFEFFLQRLFVLFDQEFGA